MNAGRRRGSSSAGNTRGLIEADQVGRGVDSLMSSSAGNTRGLIEAWPKSWKPKWARQVFRGEYPRPH